MAQQFMFLRQLKCYSTVTRVTEIGPSNWNVGRLRRVKHQHFPTASAHKIKASQISGVLCVVGMFLEDLFLSFYYPVRLLFFSFLISFTSFFLIFYRFVTTCQQIIIITVLFYLTFFLNVFRFFTFVIIIKLPFTNVTNARHEK